MQLQSVKDQFNNFYKNKFQNREIQWLYNYGNIQIQTTYLSKNYQCVVNAFQASILFLYNQKKVYTINELQDRLQLSSEDLKSSLLKLCNPKSQVLTKEISKPNFDNPNEKILLNEKFENSNIRLQLVPSPNAKMMAQGAGGTKTQDDIENDVQKERGMIIDAVIVRTMKARKVEQNNELVTTVISQITLFKAQPLLIKKRIESLIEREYLERDKEQKSKYIYKP